MAFQDHHTGVGYALARPSAAPHPRERGHGVERLGEPHLGEIEDLLLRLDRETRCHRFGHVVTDAALRAHAAKSVRDASSLIGVYAGGSLRGLLELYPCAPGSKVEAAVVVERDWRRRGLGWLLLRAAIRSARGSEARVLRLIFPRDNWPMRKLADKANARLDLVLDEICAEIAAPSAATHS